MSMMLRRAYKRRPTGIVDPGYFEFDATTTAAGQTFSIGVTPTGSGIYIDWGDGSDDTYTTSGTKTHVFSSAGVHTIRMSGTATTFAMNVGTASHLTRVGVIGGITGLTSLSATFSGRTAAIVLPRGFLAFCPTVTSYYRLFYSSPNVVLPDTMFGEISVTNINLQEAFRNVNFPGSIPPTFFDPLRDNVASVQGMFYPNSSLTGYAYPFWDWDVEPTTKFSCYLACTGLTDYATIPAAYK